MENVPDLIYAKNVKDFNKWEDKLQQLGYSNYFQILNAKDYGIPQNRKRVFMVSILGNYYYEFPKKFKLKYKLKDFLEDNVDEKYYLSDKQISDIQNWNAQEKPLENMEKIEKTNTSPTLTTRSGAYAAGMVLIKNATKKGYEETTIGDGIDISGRMEKHRGTVQKNSIQTLTTKNDRGVVVNENYIQWKQKGHLDVDCRAYFEDKVSPTTTTTPKTKILQSNLRIRKITPKEAMRLMTFQDTDTNSMKISESGIYHCAGDSICVNVLISLFAQLLGIDNVEITKKYIEEIKNAN